MLKKLKIDIKYLLDINFSYPLCGLKFLAFHLVAMRKSREAFSTHNTNNYKNTWLLTISH